MGEQITKLKCDKLLFMTFYIIFVKKLREKEKSNLFFSVQISKMYSPKFKVFI